MEVTFNTMPEALAVILKQQAEILRAFSEQKNATAPHEKELLTLQEACKLLDINRTTLWNWEKRGKVKAYGLEGRKYYKRSEILESIIPVN